jgi:hypothetical protein
MEGKLMTRNHGGGIIGRGVIEKKSLRREASGRHLGGIHFRFSPPASTITTIVRTSDVINLVLQTVETSRGRLKS